MVTICNRIAHGFSRAVRMAGHSFIDCEEGISGRQELNGRAEASAPGRSTCAGFGEGPGISVSHKSARRALIQIKEPIGMALGGRPDIRSALRRDGERDWPARSCAVDRSAGRA